MKLAKKRAKVLHQYFQDRGMEAEFVLTYSASDTGTSHHMNGAPSTIDGPVMSPGGKPLTTTTFLFQVPSVAT